MFKAFFTSFYVAALTAGLVISVIHFAEAPESIGRFAAMLSFVIGIIWWTYVFTIRLRNASFAALVVTISTATALLIAIGSQYVANNGSVFSVRMALTALILWLIYDLLVSKTKKMPAELKVGFTLPDAELTDANGKQIRLSSISGKKMLLFYRGKWCPFCVDQGREFADSLDEFEKAGVKLIAISAEKPRYFPSKVLYGLQDERGDFGKKLGIYNPSSLPLGLSLFGFTVGQNEPLGILTDSALNIIALHKPRDNRKRSTPGWFLRYLS